MDGKCCDILIRWQKENDMVKSANGKTGQGAHFDVSIHRIIVNARSFTRALSWQSRGCQLGCDLYSLQMPMIDNMNLSTLYSRARVVLSRLAGVENAFRV